MKERPEVTPNVILVDGNGILHSRSAGLACFLGIKTGIPTIGVGKTFFHHDGLTTPLVSKGITSRINRFVLVQQNTALTEEEMNYTAKKMYQPPCIVVIDKECIFPTADPNNSHASITSTSCTVEDMEALAHNCEAFAVRLQGSTQRIWGAALVGHGRRRKRSVGTKNPIFISVGHKISLKEALIICTKLCCNSRIPEPIRLADIHGREILRHNSNKKVCTKTETTS
jgi:deoxyinosine 3'endonuclease (endonuclease V)